MKQFIVLFAFSFLLAATGCRAEKRGEAVKPFKIVAIHNEQTDRDVVQIVQDGRVKLTYYATYRGGVMQLLEKACVSKDYYRLAFESIDDGKESRDCLLDIKGDGDARYIILADWWGGNSPICYTGWLIDAKDDFRIVGEVPVGETVDWPVKNPDLVFWFSDMVDFFPSEDSTFGRNDSPWIAVQLKLDTGNFPTVVIPPKKMKLPIGEYKKLMQKKRKLAFYCLYRDLAGCGWIEKAKEIARKVGFTDADIEKYHSGCMKCLRQCNLAKYLEIINGCRLF